MYSKLMCQSQDRKLNYISQQISNHDLLRRRNLEGKSSIFTILMQMSRSSDTVHSVYVEFKLRHIQYMSCSERVANKTTACLLWPILIFLQQGPTDVPRYLVGNAECTRTKDHGERKAKEQLNR